MTDYGFKRVFGEKDIMIAFLTDLLNPASAIEDVIFLDKEMESDAEEMRNVIYDLRCKTQDGGEFIVEMQNRGQTHFSNRILYYLLHSIIEQGVKGRGWNFELHPVYGVFFLNFHMRGLKPQSIRTVQLRVDETGEIFSEKIKAFTLELLEFKGKPETYPKSQIEYWLYNLVNMESMTEVLPFQTEQPIFSKMGGISELSHMDSEERRKYFNSLNKYRTSLAVMEYAIEEGLEKGLKEGLEKGMKEGLEKGMKEGLEKGMKEGLEKGLEQGRIEKSAEIARNMKTLNIPIDTIQELTGLSFEEIDNL